MKEMEDWDSSSAEGSDPEISLKDINDEELSYTSGSLPKLQFRSDVSKAQWNDEMGMAEVLQKKGKMWITTGIIRGGKTYCTILETLFLVEIGALLLVDNNGTCLSLKDMYEKVTKEESGSCWELFEVYRHLKSLGYIVGHHNVPWAMKAVKKAGPFPDEPRNQKVTQTELKETESIEKMLSKLQVDELRPAFDVYLPNSKFRKSSPGDPAFLVILIRGGPPSRAKIEVIERDIYGIPLKLCHVEHGRINFLSFKRVELPVLP